MYMCKLLFCHYRGSSILFNHAQVNKDSARHNSNGSQAFGDSDEVLLSTKPMQMGFFVFVFQDSIYLFCGGREGEREGEKH